MNYDVTDVVHWYTIKVIDNHRNVIECLCWSKLPWEVRTKWAWYFKYRAALLQVKYPRFNVESYWGHEPAQGKGLEQIVKNKIKAKKAKVTEYKNKLELAKKTWNFLFPIEQDESYIKAVQKINKLEFELRALESEFVNLTK